jgi:hypothetical protein
MVEITESNHHIILFSSHVQSTGKFTYILFIFFSFYVELMYFFSQVSHITLMPLKIRTMVHYILRGRPLRTRADIWAEEGEDNIIFFDEQFSLLKIQVSPRPMPMDLTYTCP